MTKPFSKRCLRTPPSGRAKAQAIAAVTVALVLAWGPAANAGSSGIAVPSEDQSAIDVPADEPAPPGTTVAEPEEASAAPVKLDRRRDSIFQLCPVDPPRHYTDDFGQARYFGGFHRHQGIDIFAPRGTPIRAPFNGVAKASTSAAGGLQVYVHGKKGFVFNAHLTRTGKRGRVRAGTIVGYVGNSGDARGSSTHDHFEWHPRGGRAVDSFRLLSSVCSKRQRRAAPAPPSEPLAVVLRML